MSYRVSERIPVLLRWLSVDRRPSIAVILPDFQLPTSNFQLPTSNFISHSPLPSVKRLPKLQGRGSRLGLEQLAEGLYMLKAQIIRNLAHGQMGG